MSGEKNKNTWVKGNVNRNTQERRGSNAGSSFSQLSSVNRELRQVQTEIEAINRQLLSLEKEEKKLEIRETLENLKEEYKIEEPSNGRPRDPSRRKGTIELASALDDLQDSINALLPKEKENDPKRKDLEELDSLMEVLKTNKITTGTPGLYTTWDAEQLAAKLRNNATQEKLK